jgi:predicted type IV restriction endonuclease
MKINIRRQLKRFAAHFLEAREAALNEADTVLRICRFFEDVLGYDGLRDISREAEMKNKYVDVCLKVDGRVRLLVEAKAAANQLRDRHIEQAQSYAAQNNYRWVVLTNGVDWHLYHLTFEEGIEYERAFAVSLADSDGLDEAAKKLALLHRSAVKKGLLEKFWETATALGPASIGRALFCEPVITRIRSEIRRKTGVLIDSEDLAKSLHEMLIQEARDQIGPVRIRKRRSSTKQVKRQTKPQPPLAGPAQSDGSSGGGKSGSEPRTGHAS